jgi:hypothetical protein
MKQKLLTIIITLAVFLAGCAPKEQQDAQMAKAAEQTFASEIVVRGDTIGAGDMDFYRLTKDHGAIKVEFACPVEERVTIEAAVPIDSEHFGETITYCGSSSSGVEFKQAALGGALLLAPGTQILGVVYVVGSVVGVWIAASAATSVAIEAVNYSQRHSDREHNPNFPNTKARDFITALLLGWAATSTGGNDPNRRCGAVIDKATGAVLRVVIWAADKTLPEGGFLSVYEVGNPNPWVTSYPTTLETYEAGPKETILEKFNRWWDNNHPCSKPPDLQKAQPG